MKNLKLGIIGQPLTHTLSPILHAQIMHQMDIDGVYCKYPLEHDQLRETLQQLGQEGVRGLNVTIPHKVAVMGLMDWLSIEARLAGAVNTIVFDPDTSQPGNCQTKGHNTDIAGFARSLPPAIVNRLPQMNLLIIGAGGSARAVLTALIQQGATQITFAVRSPEKMVRLISDAEIMKQTFNSQCQIKTSPLLFMPNLNEFEGVINTTPVGMWPHTDSSPLSLSQIETLPKKAFIYDLIYRPTETQLLSQARSQGLQTFNGLDMLIYQGICSFELWQDRPVPASLLSSLRQQLTQAMQHIID